MNPQASLKSWKLNSRRIASRLDHRPVRQAGAPGGVLLPRSVFAHAVGSCLLGRRCRPARCADERHVMSDTRKPAASAHPRASTISPRWPSARWRRSRPGLPSSRRRRHHRRGNGRRRDAGRDGDRVALELTGLYRGTPLHRAQRGRHRAAAGPDFPLSSGDPAGMGRDRAKTCSGWSATWWCTRSPIISASAMRRSTRWSRRWSERRGCTNLRNARPRLPRGAAHRCRGAVRICSLARPSERPCEKLCARPGVDHNWRPAGVADNVCAPIFGCPT